MTFKLKMPNIAFFHNCASQLPRFSTRDMGHLNRVIWPNLEAQFWVTTRSFHTSFHLMELYKHQSLMGFFVFFLMKVTTRENSMCRDISSSYQCGKYSVNCNFPRCTFQKHVVRDLDKNILSKV